MKRTTFLLHGLFILNCLLMSCALRPAKLFADDAQASPVGPASADIQTTAGTSSPNGLTLELQGVNILDVFKILSKKSGLNIVAGKKVDGQVSIFLQNVPVREALRTILQSQGLASIEEDGIIKVMTEADYLEKFGKPYDDKRVTKTFHLNYASAEGLAGKLSEIKSPFGKVITELRTNTLLITEIPEILQAMETLIRESDQPQQTKVFHLKYAKAEDLEAKLHSLLEGSAGKVEIDKRSNSVIVMNIPSQIEKVQSLMDAFDIQVPQVLIEAKIVEVRLSDRYRRGINWQEIIDAIGSFNTLRAAAPLVVSPPVGAASLATFALGSGQDDLQVVLDLLERVGKTNLLSTPRLTVMNNEEAKLAVATREPFVSQTVVQTTTSTNTADNVQFVDVGVTLKVQPRISHDNFVEMRVRPEVSSSNSTVELEGVAQGSNTTFTRTRIPVVTTQVLETTVQVKSGNTLIIGGLIQDSQEKDSSKVPILSSIPLLGRAFQSKSHDFVKTELVTFLTPTIVSPSEPARAELKYLYPSGEMLPFDDFGGYVYKSDLKKEKDHLFGEIPYWEDKKKSTAPAKRGS